MNWLLFVIMGDLVLLHSQEVYCIPSTDKSLVVSWDRNCLCTPKIVCWVFMYLSYKGNKPQITLWWVLINTLHDSIYIILFLTQYNEHTATLLFPYSVNRVLTLSDDICIHIWYNLLSFSEAANFLSYKIIIRPASTALGCKIFVYMIYIFG